MNSFEVPSWAGLPPKGLLLEVYKEGDIKYKRRIDRKRCYIFGRERLSVDIATEHASCSRVHAALVFNPQVGKAFLIDLLSTHGTFVGEDRVKLEPYQPQLIEFGTSFRFAVSTRSYVLKEKCVKTQSLPTSPQGDDEFNGLENKLKELGLEKVPGTPHSQDLFSMMMPTPEFDSADRKRKRVAPKTVTFDLTNEIIHLEDEFDWGNFRCTKRRKLNLEFLEEEEEEEKGRFSDSVSVFNLSPPPNSSFASGTEGYVESPEDLPLSHLQLLSSNYGMMDEEMNPREPALTPPMIVNAMSFLDTEDTSETDGEQIRKIYPKEVWPGKLYMAEENRSPLA